MAIEKKIKVCFEVEFNSKCLEVPRLVGSIPEFGSWNELKGLDAVKSERERIWKVEVDLSERSFFFFKWITTMDDKPTRSEPTSLRSFSLGVSGGTVKSIFGIPGIDFRPDNTYRLNVKTKYFLNQNESLYIVGAGTYLGNWSTKDAIMALESNCPGNLELKVNIEKGKRAEFKLIIMDRESGRVKRWQGGENRMITVEEGTDECKVFVPWTGRELVIPDIEISVCSDDAEINSEEMLQMASACRPTKSPGCVLVCDGKVFVKPTIYNKAVGVVVPVYKKSTEVPTMNKLLVNDLDTSQNQPDNTYNNRPTDQDRPATSKGRQLCQKIWNAVSCFWNRTDYYPKMLYI